MPSAMVAKRLVVTVALYSCHSGGATRGTDAAVRSIGFIDATPRPIKSQVAPPGNLAATWRNRMAGLTCSVYLGAG